ncbi:MAG: hypothetical protein K2H64_11305 [Desulfovibrio sp.]|nr:hypothetical protein [Desulfovibrio sp.]
MKLERVLIIGRSGSGKSFFARKLARLTGLPLFYLDMIWHRPDRRTVPREEFDARLEKILALERWIIDGNFQRTLARRLERCQVVFFFEIPLEDSLAGVESRLGKKRPDMPWIEHEFDEDFKRWIINFDKDVAPRMRETVARSNREIILFKSRAEADAWLKEYKEAGRPV